MTISLIGIGGLQWYWVNNAIDMEASRFDEAVNEALNEVIDELESKEALSFVRDKVPSHSELNIFFERAFSSDSREVEDLIVVNAQDGDSIDNVHIIIDDQDIEGTIWMEDSTQVVRTIRTMTVNEHDSAMSSIPDMDGVHSSYRIQLVEEVMGDVMVEYLSIENPVKSRLDGVALDSIINSRLDIHSIKTPFQYAVTSEKGDSVIANYSSDHFDLGESYYDKNLFQNDLIHKQNALLVSFPKKSSFILQSMIWMLVLLVCFTLFILASFAFTILSILQQKRLSEVKTEFINNMTHEFKTPLATISIASDSINHPDVINEPEKIKHFTALIKEEKLRLNMHIERVLQVARLEKGELSFNLSNVDINDLVKEAVNTMQLQANEKNGKIELELGDDIRAVKADQFHILNVVLNLLDNAIKYCLNEPHVLISTTAVHDGCNITVSDNGKGMSKDVLKNIFKTFYRVESGDQHNVKGFGLGLSYAKAIIEKHGGNIQVKSEEGKGTSIAVYIPLSSISSQQI